jgi:hypothetical protein
MLLFCSKKIKGEFEMCKILTPHELNCHDCKTNVRTGCNSDCKNGSLWKPDYPGAPKYVPSEDGNVNALLPVTKNT